MIDQAREACHNPRGILRPHQCIQQTMFGWSKNSSSLQSIRSHFESYKRSKEYISHQAKVYIIYKLECASIEMLLCLGLLNDV